MMLKRIAAVSMVTLLAACGGERAGVPHATLLSPEGVNLQYVRFSPDGRRVAYWEAGAGGYRLTVAAADLSGPRTLDSAVGFFEPSWSPDGTSLMYTAGGDFDIRLVSMSGGAPRQLTTSKGLEFPVQWHPKGDRIAYVASVQGGAIRSGQIAIATGAATPIVAQTGFVVPFWSPDGAKIAYMMVAGGKTTIWVADSTGRNGRQLTTEGFEGFTQEAGDPWSPDGSALVYESRRTGLADIWIVPVNGDSARQLTRDVRNDTDPHWSSDGTWVAFLSDRGRQTDVWIVPAAGGTPRRVTDDAAAETDVQWVDGHSEIAFSTGVVQRGLWTRSLADGSEHRLTPDSIRVGAFDLSPDGRRIVYQVNRGGGVSDLEMMPAGGGAARTLVRESAGINALVWSPDGSKVLYVSDKTGNQDVWVVDSAGGVPRDLVSWPTDEFAAAWSPDGSSVYFVSNRDANPLSDLWEVAAGGGEPHRLTRTGTFQSIVASPRSQDLFVLTLGGSEGQVLLNRLLPGGKLQTLWDGSGLFGLDAHAIMPSGDSVAIVAQRPGGGIGTMLLPTHGGAGRPMLGDNQGVSDWTADGARIIYLSGIPNGDIYVMSLRDGSTERLTDTPDDEGDARWLPGEQRILFYRASAQRRIATVEVGKLMAGGN